MEIYSLFSCEYVENRKNDWNFALFMRLICKFQELDTNKILRYNPDKFTEGTGVEVYFSVSATDVKAIPCICNGSLERVLRQIKKENRKKGVKDIVFFCAKELYTKMGILYAK